MTAPHDELARLDALARSRILETPREPEFDDLTRMAADVTEAPLAMISFVERDRVWLKSTHGLPYQELPRASSFCDVAIARDEPLRVHDAKADGRFSKHLLVNGDVAARSYTGVALREEGCAVGTLAVLDTKPRTLSRDQLRLLELLARQVQSLIELRRLRDTRLLKSEALLASATRISGIGCWQWDMSTGEITWSDEMFDIFGVPRSLVPTISDYQERLHPEDAPLVNSRMMLAIEGKMTTFPDYRVVRPNGEVRVLQATAELERDSTGRPMLLTGALLDVTERRNAEDARKKLAVQLIQSQKLESLNVLSAGVAHDFNNLLVGILGNAELAAADSSVPHAIRELMENVTASAIQAAGLTRQLLAYTGHGHLDMIAVDLSERTSDTIELLRSTLPSSVSLSSVLAKGLPPIAADIDQLQQVVRNLIMNAAEAYGGAVGEVRVRTSLTRFDDVHESDTHDLVVPYTPPPGRYVTVEVGDQGAGMARDVLERVFEPFYSTKFTGRGLGLAAVLGIARAHRAVLTVDSRLGHGSCFRVHFPVLERVSPSGHAPSRKSQPTAAHALSGRTVLVVDDDARVRQLERRVLEAHGVHILEAGSGDDAVELVRLHDGPVDVVLLDLVMPGLDSASTLRALRELRPALPVLVQSGYSEDEVTRRLREIDEELAFLAKPFSPKVLVSKLIELLGGAVSESADS